MPALLTNLLTGSFAPAVLTRTAAQGPPSSGSVMFNGGLAADVELLYDGLVTDRPSFAAPVPDGPGEWTVSWDGTVWGLYGNGILVYSAIGDTAHPSDAEWQGGTITLESISLAGAAVGQLCRVGDSTPYEWYRWDGSGWENIGFSTLVSLDTLSTTGGADKVPLIASDGSFRTAPINGSSGVTPPPIRVSARQRIAFENYAGVPGYGAIWLYPDHSPSGLGASHHELIYESGRHCFYWDDGFQLGNADAARGNRFIYIRNLGQPTSDDQVRESITVWFDGQHYNGGSTAYSKMGLQWVPTGDHAGELVFGISGNAYLDGTNNNKLKDLDGVILPVSITEAGPKICAGKVLTFSDGSTLSSAPNLQARTGNAVLVSGTRTISDTSVTLLTNVFLQRRTPGGTIGDLSYSTNPGVGFTITSVSATDTSTVSYRLDEALTAATAPTISGNNWVGQTLTVTSGVGGGSTFQWFSDGSAVSGQTASTYVVRHQDIGLPITCKETKTGTTLESNAIAAWKPGDETGYFADFRAYLGTLTTGGGAATNGQPVEVWQDQSGNARHLGVLATANAPLLDTSGTGGRPTHLNFDGSNDYMLKIATITRPQTVYIVAEAKSETANERYFSTGDLGTRMVVDLGASTLDVKNNGASTAGDQMTLNARHIITARTTATLNAIRVDSGTEVTATETTGNGFGMFVGGTSAGGAADQRHYALLVFEGDHDATAQNKVRDYLKAKWGTP